MKSAGILLVCLGIYAVVWTVGYKITSFLTRRKQLW